MIIQIITEATEYATMYDSNIVKVSFSIQDNCVVISGLDGNEEVVNDNQLEISKEDFLKISKLLSNQ